MEIQLWREILSPYELAVNELVEKFNHLMKEHKDRGLYSPIEQVTGRVKSVTSILEKMKKKGISYEEIEEQVEDIAGIRIICQFVEDIERVADLIAHRSDMEIKCEKDYITHIKESGYRSLHLIVEVPIFLQNEKRPMKVEIQLRTIAMDFWASLEHKLRYKKNIKPEEAVRLAEELEECARISAQLDYKMQEIRNRIQKEEQDS